MLRKKWAKILIFMLCLSMVTIPAQQAQAIAPLAAPSVVYAAAVLTAMGVYVTAQGDWPAVTNSFVNLLPAAVADKLRGITIGNNSITFTPDDVSAYTEAIGDLDGSVAIMNNVGEDIHFDTRDHNWGIYPLADIDSTVSMYAILEGGAVIRVQSDNHWIQVGSNYDGGGRYDFYVSVDGVGKELIKNDSFPKSGFIEVTLFNGELVMKWDDTTYYTGTETGFKECWAYGCAGFYLQATIDEVVVNEGDQYTINNNYYNNPAWDIVGRTITVPDTLAELPTTPEGILEGATTVPPPGIDTEDGTILGWLAALWQKIAVIGSNIAGLPSQIASSIASAVTPAEGYLDAAVEDIKLELDGKMPAIFAPTIGWSEITPNWSITIGGTILPQITFDLINADVIAGSRDTIRLWFGGVISFLGFLFCVRRFSTIMKG